MVYIIKHLRFFRFFLLTGILFIHADLFSGNLPDSIEIDALFLRAANIQNSSIDSSLLIAKRGYLLSQQINYQKGIGKAFMRIGSIMSIKEKNDSALLYLRQALSIRIKLKNFGDQANTTEQISNVYKKMGMKDSVFHYLFYTLRLYEKAGDSIYIGETYHRMAETHLDYGNEKEALNNLQKSLSIFQNAKNQFYISRTYKLYGMFYYSKNEFARALDFFSKALAIDEVINDEYELANNWNYLGLCNLEIGNTKMSEFYLRKALAYFTKAKMLNNGTEVLYNIGYYFFKQQKYDSSIYYFERAELELKNNGSEQLHLKVYSALSKSYAFKGNYLQAYNYHVQYFYLNDSLLNKEKVKQIAEMQTKYETEKKEQQISLLGEQNKTKTAQRNVLIAGSVLLLMLFLASGIYFMQRQRLAKKNVQIAQEKISGLLKEQAINSYNAMIEGQEEERKRIATDLHDRLGSMLSTVKLLFGTLNDKIDKNQNENTIQYNKANHLLDEAVLEVRRISQNLSTGMIITFGLVSALEDLCESIDKSKIIKCKLLCYGMEARLHQQTEIGIYRMIQEMVNNVLKHAKASKLTIQLNRTADSINITVEDNGVGFNIAEKIKSGGMGLKNLDARAAKMNGVYHVDSKPGHGTISIIEIPLTHDTDNNSG